MFESIRMKAFSSYFGLPDTIAASNQKLTAPRRLTKKEPSRMRLLGLLAAAMRLSLVYSQENTHSEEDCPHVTSRFPSMLRDLRAHFDGIKEYFQMNDDDLNTVLLHDDLLADFKGYQGCHSVTEMIRFYTDDVMPKANSKNNSTTKTVNSMSIMLAELKYTVKRCHRFLSCEKKSKTIEHLKESYKKMQVNGMFKAMGEFDIFINYIEEYLMSRRKNGKGH